MRKAASFWLTIAVVAVALVASAVLFVDYVRPAPVFCAADGCADVKKTIFAHPLGVRWLPLPVFGIGGFFAIALLALVPGRRARIAQACLAVFAAIVGLGLIAVQMDMGTICKYCAITDTASVLVAGLSILRAVRAWDPPPGKVHVGGAAIATLLAIGVPVGVGFGRKTLPADIPPVVAEELHKTPSGKITIVDFADFECPFCRNAHAKLLPLLEAHKGEVRVVRKNVPLRMHPHAMGAALAQCCAQNQGKGDEMAERLFTTSDLSADGCVKLATELGLDVEKFKTCVADPVTEARVKADIETFRAAKGHGLPLLFVGAHRIDGEPQDDELRGLFDLALKER
jgi:protein-disulfide isomerase